MASVATVEHFLALVLVRRSRFAAESSGWRGWMVVNFSSSASRPVSALGARSAAVPAQVAVTIGKAVVTFLKAAAAFSEVTVPFPKVAAPLPKAAAAFGKVAVTFAKGTTAFAPAAAAFARFSAKTPYFRLISRFCRPPAALAPVWGAAPAGLPAGCRLLTFRESNHTKNKENTKK